MSNKTKQPRKLKLNNVSVQYTGAAISVIIDNVAKAVGAEVKLCDRTKIKSITVDGKELRDILGFTEVDMILGNQKLVKVKMLVFKNVTNPCLIGMDVAILLPDNTLRPSWETNNIQLLQLTTK